MRRAIVALVVLAVAGAVPGPVEAKRKTPAVANIAHRGASGHAPEHTLAAYDLALKMKADYIEQDLQMTSDGVLVALHDEDLDRTAHGPVEDCTGPVVTKTLEQIKRCDVGSWFNEAFPEHARDEYVGLEIPTLEEVFQRYGPGVNYYIETKSSALYPRMEEELIRLLREYELFESAAQDRRVLIQSFHPTSLQKIHALAPQLPLIQLFFGGTQLLTPTFDQIAQYAVGIGPSYGDVDEAVVEAAHANCLDVHPYTVNEATDMQALIALGVDGMFTNFPDRLRQVTKQARVKKEETECQY